MATRDPYTVLGLSKSADSADIKRRFRQLAKKYHPDQNKDDPKAQEKFAEVNQAYEVLGEDENRKKFDRGEIDAEGKPRGFEGFPGGGFSGGGFGQRPQSGQQSYEFEFGPGGFRQSGGRGGFDPSDLFSDVFSGLRGRNGRPQPTPETKANLAVTLEEAVLGGEKRVIMPTGRSLDVKIPAGITDGKQIRLKGQGQASSHGGAAGDVLVTIQVRPHKLFKVDDRDLKLELPITIYEAVLGGKIQVPTLGGKIELNIPPNSSGGRTLRLRGKGLPASGKDAAGDLLVTLKITLPDNSPEELRDLMQKMQQEKPYSPRDTL